MEGFDPEVQASVVVMDSDEIRALWMRVADDLTIPDTTAGPILDFLNAELARRGEEIERT